MGFNAVMEAPLDGYADIRDQTFPSMSQCYEWNGKKVDCVTSTLAGPMLSVRYQAFLGFLELARTLFHDADSCKFNSTGLYGCPLRQQLAPDDVRIIQHKFIHAMHRL